MKHKTLMLAMCAVVVCCVGAFSARAQAKKKKPAARSETKQTARSESGTEIEDRKNIELPPKKNGRPADVSQSVKTASSQPPAVVEPEYVYEFSQPDFPIGKIVIVHDDTGKGTIEFTKKGADEAIKDPIVVPNGALELIRKALSDLNFLDSAEDYQYAKDYSHLGNIVFRLNRGGRQRSVKFNWTENRSARILADEYRKIGNQFIWIFDVTVARENQPLETPRLLDSLDSLLRRNEIAGPREMTAVLQSLTDDERIPLISRNHAARLIKQIDKSKK
ncbi:MAG: hypothetical protein ABI539_00810 [Acidobacteriota bacterium]